MRQTSLCDRRHPRWTSRQACGITQPPDEKVCACATFHVHVRSGAEFLAAADDEEEDQLDNAWGFDAQSRLSCCVKVKGASLVIEMPLYTKNHAQEK